MSEVSAEQMCESCKLTFQSSYLVFTRFDRANFRYRASLFRNSGSNYVGQSQGGSHKILSTSAVSLLKLFVDGTNLYLYTV